MIIFCRHTMKFYHHITKYSIIVKQNKCWHKKNVCTRDSIDLGTVGKMLKSKHCSRNCFVVCVCLLLLEFCSQRHVRLLFNIMLVMLLEPYKYHQQSTNNLCSSIFGMWEDFFLHRSSNKYKWDILLRKIQLNFTMKLAVTRLCHTKFIRMHDKRCILLQTRAT